MANKIKNNRQGFTLLNNRQGWFGRADSTGFTIVELLIATVAFSVVLLVTMATFLGIGKIFFKGVNGGQSQDTGKTVLDDISGSIKVAPSISAYYTFGFTGYNYFCVGNIRYTYGIKGGDPIMLDTTQASDYDLTHTSPNFGLLRDKLPGSSACAAPCVPGCSITSTQYPLTNPQELLSNQMRVAYLGIALSNSTPGPNQTQNLYVVNLVLAYGVEPPLAFDLSNPDINSKASCSGSLTVQQYCSVTVLSTSVFRGLHT